MSESELKDPYHLSRKKERTHLKKDEVHDQGVIRIPVSDGKTEQPAEPAEPAACAVPEQEPESVQKAETHEGDSGEVARKNAEIEDLKEQVKRLCADFENLRRRKEEEAQEIRKYASEEIIRQLLCIMDNFERALAAPSESMSVESLLGGLQMIHRQMKDMITKEGVEEIKACGELFDPSLHQAVMKVDDDSLPDESVVEELQKGYRIKEKVIRPSMVKVSRKP